MCHLYSLGLSSSSGECQVSGWTTSKVLSSPKIGELHDIHNIYTNFQLLGKNRIWWKVNKLVTLKSVYLYYWGGVSILSCLFSFEKLLKILISALWKNLRAFLVLLSSSGALPVHSLVCWYFWMTSWKLRALIQRPPRGWNSPKRKLTARRVTLGAAGQRLGEERRSRPVPLKLQTLRINPRYTVCRIISPLAGVPQTHGIANSNRKPRFLDVSWQPVWKSIKTLGLSRCSLSSFLLLFCFSSSLPPFLPRSSGRI